ncbi:hypothetical protein FisN_17Lu165 [Fistulifera solaris]|uniref:DUF501 domain-containing protein n=1 Tax=Fistulifera solaris TaxID=1519565 RepID=A0A1Z5K273_FISSO|nr:hypothetical protein FisN_17Lu165 [Fistulifera solaris]|eukprot:GAX20161.1 hypothetical protein FisN_17Lu165 [Fistulifera solaris]
MKLLQYYFILFQITTACGFLCLQATRNAEYIVPRNDDHDRELVRQQLGYVPTNWVCVSARTQAGDPIAIQTYPLQGGSMRRQAKAKMSDIGTPFPTLFWFTNPLIGTAIAELERQGYIQRIQESLNKSEKEELLACHEKYASMRWESLSSDHRQKLIEDPSLQRLRTMLQCSGVAGTMLSGSANMDSIPSIKCLHAHYAQFRSCRELGNPVGRRVHHWLQEDFPDLVL